MLRRAAPYLLLLGVLAQLVHRAAQPLTNADTYFHLRFGREFLDGWSLREPGSVSTFATADWVPTQWLSQVAMAAVEDRAGLAGVAWLSGLVLVALALTLYAVARREAEPLVAAPAVALALLASSSGLSARPQVVSYLLVALTTGAWVAATRSGRTPWWLVPLTWLWACCHGMWPVGLAIGAVAVGASAWRRERAHAVRGGLVVLLSALAALLTPVGPRLLGAVVAVGDRRRFFDEWGPPDPTDARLLGVVVLLVAAATLVVRRDPAQPLRPLQLGLLVLALVCATTSARTVPVAAAILVPLAAAAGQRLLDGRVPGVRVPEGRASRSRPERVVVLGGAVLALTVLAAVVPRTAAEPPTRPAWADPALDALPPGTPILDAWDLGGWLMWRHPDLDPVMHGYGDTFTTPELRRNSDILHTTPGWADRVRDLGVTYALVIPGSPLARGLLDEGWRPRHASSDLALLTAPSSLPR